MERLQDKMLRAHLADGAICLSDPQETPLQKFDQFVNILGTK